ncbi:MAG: ABC transporter ATP-binding protein [Firmicutes bacterium]|nr:ABC transporter ATP-binding protein [Bacillota bacterium]
MTEPAIAVENLVKKYGETPALQGISFQVYPGEVFGYLGPNGAGKTTTIRILAGLSSPTSGSCRVLGQTTFKNPALYRHLGVVFEESHLYDRLSGIENLRFFAALHGVPTARIQELLQTYDLAKAAKRPVRTYSKGMKRRLLICRALLHDPEVLIMDEPTSGLDPTSAAVIHAAIDHYRGQGKTIFLSTHDMTEAETLCDRVAFLNQGKIAALDHPKALMRRYGQPVVVVQLRPFNETSEIEQIKLLNGAVSLNQVAWEDDLLTIRLPLEQGDLGAQLDELRSFGEILTIHTQEATLGQVFREVTGTKLE